MASGETVTFSNWNNMRDDLHISHTGGLSGSYIGHSGNSGIHYVQGSITTVGTINTGTWNATAIAAAKIGSHSNTQHDNNYYYQESDLTGVLNNNYYPSGLGNTLNTSYTGHSGNVDKHYPSSQITSWLDGVYAPTGTAGANFYVYPDNEEVTSTGGNIYFSGQGTTYVYSGSHIIIISSQVGSAGDLSDLTIDVNKDWNYKGIDNLQYLYGQDDAGGDLILKANDSDSNPSIYLYGGDQLELRGESRIDMIHGSDIMFRFDYIGDDAFLYGGNSASNDLILRANVSDALPYIKMDGAGSITYDSDSTHYFYKDGNQVLKMLYNSPRFYLYGPDVSSDDFYIFANDRDEFSYIQMEGSGSTQFYQKDYFQFWLGNTSVYKDVMKLTADVDSHISNWYGGHSSSHNLRIFANFGDSIPKIEMSGNGKINIDAGSDTIYMKSNVDMSDNKFIGAVSSQYLSGQLLALHKSRDISGWDSSTFTNSGLMWNGSNWVAMPSGGGAGSLSTLTIDTDKDWDSKGILNITYLSSTTISGGTILGHLPSSQLSNWFNGVYAPSTLTSTHYTEYTNHSSQISVHYTSGSVKTWFDGVYSPTGTAGYWTQVSDDIYYDTGEVHIGHSDFDVGEYKLQVSGSTYLSGTTVFKGNQISGIATPTYNSGVANKKYVDDNAGVADEHYVYPDNEKVGSDGSNKLFISGQGNTYVYSGTNTIIISSATAGGGDLDKADADGYYYPSGLGNTLNNSYTNHSGNTDIHFPSSQVTDWLDGVYAPTGAGELYYPSSLGNSLNTSYINHSSNTSNPHEVTWSDVSTDATIDLDNNYAPSGTLKWANLSGLSNVTDGVPISGASLRYDGTNWAPCSGASTSLFASKPNAATHYGQMIRVSGSSTNKTYVFMSVRNDAGSWEWIQLGVST